jgi:tetratricopeptide (TPR) repeat protein
MAAVTRAFEPSDTDLDATRVDASEPSSAAAEGTGHKASLARGATVGRYLIVDELGAGGMGEVFSAWDPELDRRIALKLVKLSQREKAADARNRLLREAQALAKLSHPNVVAVYDVGTHGDRVFIAMEYVEGRTMGDWIEQQAPSDLPSPRWREGLALMLQAGRGLAAAHAEGLVHRDFKPANIMVSDDGRVRVLDFGLARRFGEDDPEDSGPTPRDASADSLDISGPFSHSSRSSLRMQLTQAGMVMGTPAYMAPEQFFGGHIDARTDQFSFCIVLYRVLMGVRPFAGETFHELGRAVARGELRELPKASGVPRTVRLVLRRGLSVGRDQRYPTMDALLHDLERATAQGRRRLWLASAAAAVVLVGGVGGAMALAASEAEAPCKGAPAKLEGVWDEPLRTQMAAAFERTALPYAEDVRTATERSIDTYTERWVDLHVQTCEATRVRGDQSEALMDLRIGCLDGKLRDVAALTTVLASADVKVVENAAQAAQALGSPEDCAALEREAANLWRPDDPEAAAAVEQVREQVAKARAFGRAGKYDEGLAATQLAALAARQTGYDPVIAEAAVSMGELSERKMLAPAARDGYEEALYAAAASGHGRIEAHALIGLLSVWGMHLNDTEGALRYGKHAEAVLERLGHPPDLEAALALYRGNTLMQATRLEAAVEAFGRAIQQSEGIAAAERIHLAALNNLAAVHGQQGHYREAAAAFVRALELTEERMGPWHPIVGTNHNNLGVTYARLEDYERAMHHAQRALEIYGKSLAPDHPEVGRAYHNLGVVQSLHDDTQASYESYEKALGIKTRGLGPDHISVAFSSNNVGDALIKLGRPAEAIPYCEEALRIWTKAQGENSPSNIFALVSLGEANLALGRPEKAVPPIRRALVIAEVAEIDPIEIAKARFVAARAVWSAGGDRKEALELARQAKVGYEASDRPSVKELAVIDAWIAKPG